ncbi:hypothetical protein OEZ85_004454 [Tetradesmus obliquus]|uniref:S1 motif domain-containing protein n=1 Tax=Tetradesmus obliquus TaxID=3088 RepID=A0ABY8URD2_TETOB|nr:hypothetical protein OEZ85_004454 [Tetradesmus obliquus]
MSDAGEDEFAGLPEEEEEFVDDEAGSGSGEEEAAGSDAADAEDADADEAADGDGDGEAADGEGDGEAAAEGEAGSGSGSADSSEEEEDGENEYEEDGFVVDEDVADEEGEEGSEEHVGRKKRKKRRRDFALDEEDYELLEDNQVRVKRPAERKRLKRRGEEGREPGREKASGAKQLQEALFGTGDLEDELEEDMGAGGRAADEPGSASPGGGRRNRYDDFGGDLSDEMDDFIVDGEDGDRRRARRRRDARVAQAAGLSTAAVQAANRLFGNFGELLDLHQSHRLYDRPDAGGEEDEEAEDEGDLEGLGPEDEDEAERRRLERQERAAARRTQKLLQQVDPELVESHFLRPADQAIRQADIPERLQLLGKSVLESVPEDGRRQLLDEAARWVADHLFGQHSTESKVREVVEDGILEVTGECPRNYASGQFQAPGSEHLWPPWVLDEVDPHSGGLDLRNNRALLVRRGKRFRDYAHMSHDSRTAEERRILERWRSDPEEQAALRKAVRTVLEHVFERQEEVPLIAMYRKEQCGELLSLRETDIPETTGNERKAQTDPDDRYPKGTIQPKHRRIRRWDVLWAVFNMGVRFMELYKRRIRRIDVYQKTFDNAATEEERDMIAACHEQLINKMHTVQGMDDIDAKFKRVLDVSAAFGSLSLENGEGGGASASAMRRPGRPNAVKKFVKLGLPRLIKDSKVCLAMEAFKENVEKHEAINMPDDPPEPPQDWARQQITLMGWDDEEAGPDAKLLAQPQQLLRAMQLLLVGELAAEPCLRQVVRNELYQYALLSTTPTAAGEEALDPFHPYAITKRLADKKVSSLEGSDTWLRILAAEKAGLITVKIEWPEANIKASLADASLADVGELFVSDNIAEVAVVWNDWRRGVLQAAVQERLLPAMLAELKARLTSNAIETAMLQVQDRFWHFVSQQPVRILEVPDDQTEQEPVQMETPRFMAVVWGAGQDGDGPTTLVQLDGQGNLKDLLTAGQLSGNVPRTVNSGSREAPVFDPAADPKKSRDSHKIREKILEHKPNAILVAASSPQSKQIKDDMEKISQYTESDARFKDELLPHLENKRVDVMWGDDRVAGLWANSEAAKAEFPDYSFLVRKAVGLGRMALDPLAVISTLLGRRKELLSLQLHDLQAKLPQELLASRLEQTLISAVAQIGVDLNAMAANTWRQAPLQFVPGLGPRKARSLLAAVAANDNHVKTRVDLLRPNDADTPFGAAPSSDLQQLGVNVFRNAAPFLRVRRGEVAALQNEEEFDALDDARIHPENETLLQVILEEAFPDLVEAGSGVDVRTAIEAPGNLQQLDLWSVADANNHLFKLPTLVDMLHELLAPYAELRLTPGTPDDEEAFYLRHGETRDSLKDGKLVEAKVIWVGETEVKVVIQSNGMEAIIPQSLVSSSNSMPQLSQLFKPGAVVTARITKDDASQQEQFDERNQRRVTMYLTTATAKLQAFEKWERHYCADVDKAYKMPEKKEQQQQQQPGGQQPAPRQRVPPLRRPVEHPMWVNKRFTEVAAELQSKPVGSALFHPASSKPLSEQLKCISLSIKLAQLSTGVLIQHVEVLEPADKPAKQPRLATPLRIKVEGRKEPFETYEDLDEVVARFVEPLVEKVTEVAHHRKSVDGDTAAVNQAVRAQQAQMAGRAAAYCVALDSHRPGTGCIAWSAGVSSNVYREYFTVTPHGFFFRGRLMPSVEHVISAFKQNPNYRKQKELEKQAQRQAAGGYHGAPVLPGGQPHPYGQQQPLPYGAAAAAAGGGGYGVPQYGGAAGGYGAPPAAAAAAAAAAGGYGAPPGYGAAPGGFPGGRPAPGFAPQQQQMGVPGGFPPPGGVGPPGGFQAGAAGGYQQAAGGYQPSGGYQQGYGGYQGR